MGKPRIEGILEQKIVHAYSDRSWEQVSPNHNEGTTLFQHGPFPIGCEEDVRFAVHL